MAGIRGRGSKLRIKLSSGYTDIPGCQDISLNYPSVSTLDASDQDTLPGTQEVLPGDVSEGSCEVPINFNPQEPTHVAIYDALRAQTVIDWQVKVAGPGNKRHAFSGPVRSFPVVLSKDGLQRGSLTIGVGDFGPFEADT